ncbi:MAG: phosphoribosylamine--glycine ligase [Vicinamibacteria bacterium]|nr:phosphoribosylamine--glycine ligase [Vicinamibacteria bacterium]
MTVDSMPDSNSVLVVGSWAKEHITIEHLKRIGRHRVYAYMDARNPGIEMIADDCRVGRLDDLPAMAAYARECRPGRVLITTAKPLSLGLVDMLEMDGFSVFGPSKSAARLESDKAFARNLMLKHRVGALPRFGVFDRPIEAEEYARELKWDVAIKPIGLTDGLGVRVAGVQLMDDREIVDYIRKVFERKIGGESRVLVEERIAGEEFTLQCLVSDDIVLPTLPVQDFKKLRDGDTGPNTASMGSYSMADHLLPFLEKRHFEEALEVIRRTLAALREETGQTCRGFLYGQFMLTSDGIRLVEYNFRPGDPEWINVMRLQQTDLIDVITSLQEGDSSISADLRHAATVCKYVVPHGYPERLNEPLDLRIDASAMSQFGVGLYYSCGREDDGRLRVGTERGIAFVAEAPTVPEASIKVEAAIASVQGDFFHRRDIGSVEMMAYKEALIGGKIAECSSGIGKRVPANPCVHSKMRRTRDLS